ncbi:dihydroorotate dehydrogenase [Solibacillus sp. MA9]|uniref:Dihydroorotate dehydrogenase n=1 Tax=Solibacillus palustris TaxID=2908203 RepID=A0ABS9U9U1_9BACL|nr:dihydroorotate dehydrogenase [Solibacillus sp. MA9]MCH7321093.1 dihydroorotate dehydrogenase [Solibacillus sp. MA9]
MPDWSYHPLKKILFSKIEAKKGRQFIHYSMSTIASLPGGKHVIEFLGHNATSSLLHKQLNNTNFKSPIGLSGMLDPELTGTKAFQELGFGYIEIGPIVFRAPTTQIAPQWQQNQIAFSTSSEKVTLNRALQVVVANKFHVPLFARLDEGLCAVDLQRCMEHLSPFVDGFFLYSKQLELLRYEVGVPIYQILSANQVHSSIQLAKSISGVVIDAPFLNSGDRLIEQGDGLYLLQEAVQLMKKQFSNLPIITNGAINAPSDALILNKAGADLMMLTEGFVNTGPGLPKRIHERLLVDKMPSHSTSQWHWSFIFGLAIFIGGFIALYFALTTVILQYDEKFIGLTSSQLILINPKIIAFMAHDRMSLAGTMISAGILYMTLAYFGLRRQLHWANVTFHSAAIIGFLGISLFIGYGYFDWLHGLFWLALLPIYIMSWRERKNLKASPQSWHDTNDLAWKRAVYGQLLFVILGFSLLIGGLVISIIGITTVFVTTDISFLCMDSATLQAISNRLIPVIAHDRAGFGSALVSVGILVLCLSLWGFRAGERWLWFTFAFGALPAFLAGIGTHFAIGYTSFIHLVPLYFLCVLYVVGLVLSYSHLTRQKV